MKDTQMTSLNFWMTGTVCFQVSPKVPLGYGLESGCQTVAEVAGDQVFQLHEKAWDQLQIQSVLGIQLGQPLLVGLGAGCL